jgi:anti-sigma factor RsiW
MGLVADGDGLGVESRAENLFVSGRSFAMTCRELIDSIAGYLSEELSDADRAAFAAHLEECPECVAYLKSYEDTIALTKAVFDERREDLGDVPEKLVQAILAARGKGRA